LKLNHLLERNGSRMGLSTLRLGYTQPIEENVADPDLVADAIEVVAGQLGGVDPRTVEVAPRTVDRRANLG
jgi:hypothetical protein